MTFRKIARLVQTPVWHDSRVPPPKATYWLVKRNVGDLYTMREQDGNEELWLPWDLVAPVFDIDTSVAALIAEALTEPLNNC